MCWYATQSLLKSFEKCVQYLYIHFVNKMHASFVLSLWVFSLSVTFFLLHSRSTQNSDQSLTKFTQNSFKVIPQVFKKIWYSLKNLLIVSKMFNIFSEKPYHCHKIVALQYKKFYISYIYFNPYHILHCIRGTSLVHMVSLLRIWFQLQLNFPDSQSIMPMFNSGIRWTT